MTNNLNKLWTIKAAMENKKIVKLKTVNKTAGGKAQLILMDINDKIIGFTRFYDEKKIIKKISKWLFKDFPKGV